ncbi:YebG family protein [Marinobacter sp.]|uniref:YebG family protein n=1 Tax=Marinobacter sp. TaxID=50741 RepID=UPI001A05708A|nr:YebG family protein [Marinobacter sp.]MBE0485639.1 YebG family protein [Marinobacter sp.]
MAVQSLFYSDRDGLEMALKTPDSMLFTTKADADARDKMLELSENIQLWLEKKIPTMPEEFTEQCALLIAENKDLFQRALKKPELLSDTETTSSD